MKNGNANSETRKLMPRKRGISSKLTQSSHPPSSGNDPLPTNK